jgi:hypothetical protein
MSMHARSWLCGDKLLDNLVRHSVDPFRGSPTLWACLESRISRRLLGINLGAFLGGVTTRPNFRSWSYEDR